MSEEITAIAKAVEESSKLGVELLEKGEKICKFICKLTGLTDDGRLGIIKDKYAYIRWERQNRMIEEYNRQTKNRVIFSTIEPKFLIPLYENAILEEDNSLQDLWVKLLVNWTSNNYKEEKRMAYIDIIKSLTSLEAKILEAVYNYYIKNKSNSEIVENIEKEDLEIEEDVDLIMIKKEDIFPELPNKIYFLSIENLMRVRCLKIANTWGQSRKNVNITYLGICFVEACIKDYKGNNNG